MKLKKNTFDNENSIRPRHNLLSSSTLYNCLINLRNYVALFTLNEFNDNKRFSFEYLESYLAGNAGY